jgi:hypothetical protein
VSHRPRKKRTSDHGKPNAALTVNAIDHGNANGKEGNGKGGTSDNGWHKPRARRASQAKPSGQKPQKPIAHFEASKERTKPMLASHRG